jgi:hypothetical protein
VTDHYYAIIVGIGATALARTPTVYPAHPVDG